MSIASECGVVLPSPLVEVHDERLGSVRLLIKRDDLTFGGAYSNHLRAVAAAGRLCGFATIGVVRGEEEPFNDVLARAVADGMRLHYLDRATYRRKAEADVMDGLRRLFGDFYLIPEGGTTRFVVPGFAELLQEIDQRFDVITCPVGTGGTLAGLAAGVAPGRRAIGFSVLRGATSLDQEVALLLRSSRSAERDDRTNWRVDHRFHGGGFARRSPEIDEFRDDFAERHGLLMEQVYVAKMMFGVYASISEGLIGSGETVVAVLTGSNES